MPWRPRGSGAEATACTCGASALKWARYSPFMAAEIVFSGGERLFVPSSSADQVMARMTTEGSRDHQAVGGARVRPGFIDFESDLGTVYIRPDQVAYVCDA